MISPNNPDGLHVLRSAIARCRGNILFVIFFSFFINLLIFVGPLYMLQIYDRVLASRSTVTLLVLTGLALSLLVVYALLEVVRSRILVRTGLLFDSLLSDNVVLRAFKGYVQRPGKNYSQAPRDVDALREFITGAGVIAFCDAPWVPIFIAVCFMMHFWLGIVALVGALLIFVLAVSNEILTRKSLQESSTAGMAANQYVSANLRNAETVQALGMSRAVLGRWNSLHEESLTLQAKASDRAGAIMGSFKAVRMSLQIAILGVGAYYVILGEISAGTMIAASIMMGRALAPVEAAVGQWRQFVGARSAYERVRQLLQSTPEYDEHMPLPVPKGHFSIERLFVAPPASNVPTLKNISLEIMPGEVVAVVGPSGAGKSSFARALVGVWKPVSGVVRLDGAELDQWDSEALGPHIGYLPQEVELFSGTIAENISRFGEIHAQKVIEAARAAGAHDMILRLADGYDTRVGEGGRALSGGQRQRVALARAMYGEPRILVLDEPNASLDQEGEKALAAAISHAKRSGCTVIVVSHRTSLLNIVDKALVLTDGTVARFDTPATVFGLSAAAPSNVSPLRTNAIPASAG